jgi:hypothetical protein
VAPPVARRRDNATCRVDQTRWQKGARRYTRSLVRHRRATIRSCRACGPSGLFE